MSFKWGVGWRRRKVWLRGTENRCSLGSFPISLSTQTPTVDVFCQTCPHHTSASEVERNHKMSLHGLPWIRAKPHSASVINDTIKPNPACPKGMETRGKGRRKKSGGKWASAVKQNDERCRWWRSVWQVQEVTREPPSCQHGLCGSGSRFRRQICRFLLFLPPLFFDHIRGVTHWWSLIPQIEKGCPRKEIRCHLCNVSLSPNPTC